jgi:hypothetical protein
MSRTDWYVSTWPMCLVFEFPYDPHVSVRLLYYFGLPVRTTASLTLTVLGGSVSDSYLGSVYYKLWHAFKKRL